MSDQVEGRVKLDNNNNNTGAIDNREQQMDSGGSTLLVSGYYEQSAISGVTSKMVTMSLYHCHRHALWCVLSGLYFWFIETIAFWHYPYPVPN